MSKLVIASIGPASSVQDGGRPGAQRYGLVPSGAMDRLALAAANTLVGNEPFMAAVEVGPFGAKFTARGGAVRVALAGAPRNADIAGRAVASDTSATLADGETLTLGFARGGSFSYLAIEGGIAGEPMFGSLAVNARAGLGSPYPRPLQAGDELQTKAASGMAERRIELPAASDAPIRIVWGPQDDDGHMLHPGDVAAVGRFLHGNVSHGVGRRSAMPVLFTGRNPDDIAGANFPDRSAFGLHPSDP